MYSSPASIRVRDEQVSRRRVTPTSAMPEKEYRLKRSRGPGSLRRHTRPTKTRRTESHSGLTSQPKCSPTPELTPCSSQSSIRSSSTSDQSQKVRHPTVSASPYRKRGRSADMCGQFEDLVGVTSPCHQRSSLPPPQSKLVTSAVATNNFSKSYQYDQQRPIKGQKPMAIRPGTSVLMETINCGQEWRVNTFQYFLDSSVDLNKSAPSTLDPYRLELNMGPHRGGIFAPSTSIFPSGTWRPLATQQLYNTSIPSLKSQQACKLYQ